MSRRQNPDQLATLTAHAAQLQDRLLIALDTLDSQSLAHTSEVAALQDTHDKLATRARRLEYERKAAHEDLAEMTAVLELVIEKVSAANDYKVLAHSNLHLPSPLSPPRTRSSTQRTSSHPHTPTDASAYTTALVSALTAQLDTARAQAARERADAERKIARLEAMVELRDIEIKRNLRRSVNAGAGEISREIISSGSEAVVGASRGMSRGEAITAYESVARDNERLEKEVARLRSELAAAEFQRATNELGPASSWAQLPDWALPQPKPDPQPQIKPRRPRQNQTPPIRSGSSDHAPSSTSEPRASSSNSELYERTRSSATADQHTSRTRGSRHVPAISDSEGEVSGKLRGAEGQDRRQGEPRSQSRGEDERARVGSSRQSKRGGLRDSGFGADSGTDTTRNVARAGAGAAARVRTSTRERERDRKQAVDRDQVERDQQTPTITSSSRRQDRSQNRESQTVQTDATPTPNQSEEARTTSIQLMPLLPVLTPSKVRAPRVEAIELPNTSYIEPSFGIHLTRRRDGGGEGSDNSSLLEPPRTVGLGPVPSPGTVSPVGELLPPSVISQGASGETGGDLKTLTSPVIANHGQLPSIASIQEPSVLSVEPAHTPPSHTPTLLPINQLEAPIPLHPAPVLQPAPSIFQPSALLSFTLPSQIQRQQRSRSNSRTPRLSPLPVFDLTGLPAYEAVPGTSAALTSKIGFGTDDAELENPNSPTRRRSDPAPATSPGSPGLVRQRSNSAIPAPQRQRADSMAPSTPPRSTNNTAQFAFITPVADRTAPATVEVPPAGAEVGNMASTNVKPGTVFPGNLTLGSSTLATSVMAANPTNNSATVTNANVTSRRRLLPLFKFMSPSPGTPPSTKKRRANRAKTAPSQISGSGEGGSPGIASSPLARGRSVRESPLQLVMGGAHAAARREGMRVPVMREVGSGGGGLSIGSGAVGLVPPLVPSTPLVPLVAPLVAAPGVSTEAQVVVRGMQAERALLGRAEQQLGQGAEVTAESMAKVLLIEAECLRLRRNSAEAAALRQEVDMLRAQLQQREQTGAQESLEQDYTTTTSTSHVSDAISESAETYSNADAESDDTMPTATEATLPEAHMDPARRRLSEVERGLRDARAELDTKERAVAELRMRLGGA